MNAGNIALCLVGGVLLFVGYIVVDMSSPASSGGVGSASSIAEVRTSTQPVLVEFYADWCGPCRAVEPEVEALSQELKGKATVVRINVDSQPAVAAAHGVRGIPTFIAFKYGRETSRHSGGIPKSMMKEMIGL